MDVEDETQLTTEIDSGRQAASAADRSTTEATQESAPTLANAEPAEAGPSAVGKSKKKSVSPTPWGRRSSSCSSLSCCLLFSFIFDLSDVIDGYLEVYGYMG